MPSPTVPKTPAISDDDRLLELNARIAKLDAEAKDLDHRHGRSCAGITFADPDGKTFAGRRVIPTPGEMRRSLGAVRIRERFFLADVQLQAARAERAQLLLDRLPDDATLAGETARTYETFQTAKKALDGARGVWWQARENARNAAERRATYLAESERAIAEAAASRARAERYRGEREALERVLGPAESPAESIDAE